MHKQTYLSKGIMFYGFPQWKTGYGNFVLPTAVCNMDWGIRWLAFNDADEVVFAANV